MSLFLGKIHYWLFNKVLWFEGLEDEIISLIKKEGYNINELEEKINNKYGSKLENKNLEEIIDHNNIHKWLESKINSAEARMASWTGFAMENNLEDKLESLYIAKGIKDGKEAEKNKNHCSAIEIYNSINDYILDGMPCDRVNELIISQEDTVKWKRRLCVHKGIWEELGVDIKVFYKLRGLWIKAFVKEVNSNFKYIEVSEEEFSINRSK